MAMPSFAEVLQSGKFIITAELNPPKGTDLTALLAHAERLSPTVNAFNITDSHSARMTMSPLAVARLLVERGITPILQVTCRDRNRLALQADLLGAAALGIHNIVCMTGDPPAAGDHPDTRPVFDLDALALMRAAAALQSGKDLSGQTLLGSPQFCVGAVVNPGAADLDRELRRMEEKVALGAQFLQTQAVYDLQAFATFMQAARQYGVPILASILVLRSGNMARRLHGSLPGLSIPPAVIEALDKATDPLQAGLVLAGRLVSDLQELCQGAHLIAVGQEQHIPIILQEARLLVP